MTKLIAVLVVVLSLVGCVDGSSVAHRIGSLSVEQIECHWTDADAPVIMPDAPEGMCWCLKATETTVGSAPGVHSACDAQALPSTYCTAPGAPVQLWHMIGADAERLPLEQVPCENVQ